MLSILKKYRVEKIGALIIDRRKIHAKLCRTAT